ncbi:nicotinamide mononucleotide transporter [Maribellus sp. CM-23]|uniref:nicotinamide riboside transporter PnuC n=1 Tax=Maribellus sp. CM-23 TaxID=2781026 RepID=UPI001F32C532|nr:nicotinamide riboside transporter PnuC [Maribellus sp. CM-23]MCE4562741.1 nicotinamide mononucleotide transporter [Maribellus sp. CM-23]
MTETILEWLSEHQTEVLGAILGMIYIFFSIRQNIFTWPTGLISSFLYVIVFFDVKLYADMGLQVYYVVISLYGWYFWMKGKKPDAQAQVPVRLTTSKLRYMLVAASVVLYALILFILKNFTDSDVPYLDSLTTALSIVATWMLAKKYVEHWLIWIFVDAVSAGLYVYKGLWATVILFSIYTFMAIYGYFAWKKDLLKRVEAAS